MTGHIVWKIGEDDLAICGADPFSATPSGWVKRDTEGKPYLQPPSDFGFTFYCDDCVEGFKAKVAA